MTLYNSHELSESTAELKINSAFMGIKRVLYIFDYYTYAISSTDVGYNIHISILNSNLEIYQPIIALSPVVHRIFKCHFLILHKPPSPSLTRSIEYKLPTVNEVSPGLSASSGLT